MLEQLHKYFVEPTLFGRYIAPNHISPLIEKLSEKVAVTIIGSSVLGSPIYCLTGGNGPKTILMWSQMHGNESTTTKALFDFLNFFTSENELAIKLRSEIKIVALPMLNPDGANKYTRVNAADVDLNRDFADLSQPESQALFKVFQKIQPDYCFNLHDQRTIFGAGDIGKPATVSFLAPSYNESCEINHTREKAIRLILAMNQSLQQIIPNQVGRFDDSFNINCVGDTFQNLGCPTVLFEAGHFPNDYEREITRKIIFIALITGLEAVSENDIVNCEIADYFKIPSNQMNFFDIVYKNVKINYDGNEIITNFASQFKEVLDQNVVRFNAFIEEVSLDENTFGHFEIDLNRQSFKSLNTSYPKMGDASNFTIGSTKFLNGMPVN